MSEKSNLAAEAIAAVLDDRLEKQKVENSEFVASLPGAISKIVDDKLLAHDPSRGFGASMNVMPMQASLNAMAAMQAHMQDHAVAVAEVVAGITQQSSEGLTAMANGAKADRAEFNAAIAGLVDKVAPKDDSKMVAALGDLKASNDHMAAGFDKVAATLGQIDTTNKAVLAQMKKDAKARDQQAAALTAGLAAIVELLSKPVNVNMDESATKVTIARGE